MIAPAKPAPRPLPVTVANPDIAIPDSAIEAVVSLLLGVVDRQDNQKEIKVTK